MTTRVLIAENQVAGQIDLDDIGVSIPGNGSFDLTETLFVWEVQESADLFAQVQAGNILINDGSGTLGQEDSEAALRPPGEEKIDYNTDRIENIQIALDGYASSSHATSHILGGGDEIDGDQISIDFTPINYNPDISPPEVSDVDNLSAHLSGIDAELGANGTTFAIWAEENGDLGNNSYEWAFGNGDDTPNTGGVVIPISCECYALTLNLAGGGSATVRLEVNGSDSGASITSNAQDSFITLGTPVAISAGDRINFFTVTGPGNITGNRVAAFFRANVASVAGANEVTVRKNSGTDTGTRRRLNFIEGSNITMTIADDVANDEVDITIDATGGGSAINNDLASFYLNASGTTFTTTPITVPLTNVSAITTGSIVLAASEVTITQAGVYLFSYDVSLTQSTNSRTSSTAFLERNQGGGFFEVLGTRSFGYHRNSVNDEDTLSATIALNINANDKVRIRTNVVAGGTLGFASNGSRLSVIRTT